MIRRSIRVRLLIGSALSIAAALLIASFVLIELFERHVERRIDAELAGYVNQLAGAVVFEGDGFHINEGLADPRFDRPLGGLYWQILEEESGLELRSRSLWDGRLALPPDSLSMGTAHAHEVAGPGQEPLRVIERLVIFEVAGKTRALRIAAAITESAIEQAAREFASDLRLPLLGLALALIAAAAVQVWFGLTPLKPLRRAVQNIRARRAQRLTGRFPSELDPLVQEFNALLESQEKSLEQARNRAADFAHGMKTPLTVARTLAGRLAQSGRQDEGRELTELTQQMQEQVERELSRARLAAGALGGAGVADLAKVAERVIATLKRTPKGEGLEWHAKLSSARAAVDPADAAELLGNLLENAVKWAKSTIALSITPQGDKVLLEIGDDGPGVAEAALADLGRRGHRLDEDKPGSGMGLSIVREVVGACRGEISFSRAQSGGLSVKVELPAAL